MIAVPQRHALLSPAAMLGLKLYALAAMVVDHVDWMLFDGALGFHATWGRTVFPIFAVLLAMNLARSDRPGHLLHSVSARMLFFGVLATLPYVVLQGSWLPLNVMFTLSAAVAVVALVQMREWLWAFLAAALCGVLVDYSWFGILAVLVPWYAFRNGLLPSVAIAAACLLLYPINGNLWALAALPLIVIASYVEGDAPRWKWLFYVAYPAHLVVLALLEDVL